jgi:hypothetical protein
MGFSIRRSAACAGQAGPLLFAQHARSLSYFGLLIDSSNPVVYGTGYDMHCQQGYALEFLLIEWRTSCLGTCHRVVMKIPTDLEKEFL